MEHAGIHRAPPPRTLGPRRKLPQGCSRGCPTSRGEPELSAAAAEAQLESAPPGTCSSYQRTQGGRKHLKSKSICKQEHASQAPGKPAPSPSPRAADSSGPQENHRGAALEGIGGLEDGKETSSLYILGLFGSVQVESSWLLGHRQHVSDFRAEEMKQTGFGHLLVTKRCPC